jgi:hypothetical protein
MMVDNEFTASHLTADLRLDILQKDWDIADKLTYYYLNRHILSNLHENIKIIFDEPIYYCDGIRIGNYLIHNYIYDPILNSDCIPAKNIKIWLWVYIKPLLRTSESDYIIPLTTDYRSCICYVDYFLNSPNLLKGKDLLTLYMHKNGCIDLKTAMKEIAGKLKLTCDYTKLLFIMEYKDKYNVPIDDKHINYNIQCIIHPIVYYNKSMLSQIEYFNYYTHHGRWIFCIQYLKISNGTIIFLPISAWMINHQQYEFLYAFPNHNSKYPLLHLPEFQTCSDAPVLIAPNERLAKILMMDFADLLENVIVTSWTGGSDFFIEKTDWTPLKGRDVIIFAEFSEQGYRKARNLYLALEKAGAVSVKFISNAPLKNLSKEATAVMINNAWARMLTDSCIHGNTLNYTAFLLEGNEYFHTNFDYRAELHALPLPQLLEMPDVDGDWALRELIRSNSRVLIYAAKGIGKTWFGMILSLLMLAGRTFAPFNEQGGVPQKVLIIDGENPVHELKTRLSKLAKGLGIPQAARDNILIESAHILEKSIHLSDENTRTDLLDTIKWANVIVMDNLNALWEESLQSTPEACAELNGFINQLSIQGKTVLVVHHASRKGEPFGSSTKLFSMDLVIELEKIKAADAGFKVIFKNNRSGPPTSRGEYATCR